MSNGRRDGFPENPNQVQFGSLKYGDGTNKASILAGLALLTICAIAIHGYHVGIEDQDVYLAAAKKWLHPSLYPVNAEFFTEQMKAALFIPALAATARVVTLEWALLGWHVGSLFLVLLGCWRIAEVCFDAPASRWAAVATVAVLLTLPIAGTALYPVDPYLHPRAPASAGVLLAAAAALERRWGRTGIWILFALAMHPLMGLFGLSLLAFLCLPFSNPALPTAAFAFVWFQRPSPAWNEAVQARSYYFPLRWQWYEWLGMLAPLGIIWAAGRIAERHFSPVLQRITSRLVLFAFFQTGVALLMTVPASMTVLPALQPMRWLHIFYFFFLVIVGGMAGEFILRDRVWASILIFGCLAGAMYYVQRDLFAHSNHLELPGRPPANPWQQAFLWIRANTSSADVFALDPKYMELPEEDAYGFRAWAERSMLAEDQKDPGAATVFPELAAKWQEQVHATRGIQNFTAAQFGELRDRFAVRWVVLPASASPPLSCPFRDEAARVCRIE